MTDWDKERRRTGEGTISLECMTMQTILAFGRLTEIGRLRDCVGPQAFAVSSHLSYLTAPCLTCSTK
jgi:hypothetical protein